VDALDHVTGRRTARPPSRARQQRHADRRGEGRSRCTHGVPPIAGRSRRRLWREPGGQGVGSGLSPPAHLVWRHRV